LREVTLSFYAELRRFYDEIFPLSAELSSLLETLSDGAPPGVVADAGCGTGNQMVPLARKGRAVIGFDPDPAMVEAAREKLAPYPCARVVRGGFAELADVAGDGLAGVVCVGNSLPHVPPREALRFVADAGSHLAPGGFLLLQVLNYGRLPREGTFSLPDIAPRGGAVRFRRSFRHAADGRLLFRGELAFPGAGGETVRREHETSLWPLLPHQVEEAVEGAGFTSVERFGDFAGTPFQPDSEAFVCLAHRP
jgi:SAM-dependent methyltransferase